MKILGWQFILAATLITCGASDTLAQVVPPGKFSIDNIPVNCGTVVTVLDPRLNDVGMNDMRGHIYINPNVFNSQPTVLKLFWYAHECGHSVVGVSENEADCWAIKTGKQQGWFSPQDFGSLTAVFKHNPDDWIHLPGQARVAHIKLCYGLKPDDSDEPDSEEGDDAKGASPRDVHGASDPPHCASEYHSCVKDITSLDACIGRKQRGCMRDCLTNYHYGQAACEERFCNPDAGTNGRWERSCNERIQEETEECTQHRTTCRDLSQR